MNDKDCPFEIGDAVELINPITEEIEYTGIVTAISRSSYGSWRVLIKYDEWPLELTRYFPSGCRAMEN